MAKRNTTQFLIETFKEQGVETIQPNSTVRLVSMHLDSLPTSWQGLSRDALVKKVREVCELGASGGKLKRRRMAEVKGYVYDILI